MAGVKITGNLMADGDREDLSAENAHVRRVLRPAVSTPACRPARAVATFLCCIAIGTAAAYVADRGLLTRVSILCSCSRQRPSTRSSCRRVSQHTRFVPGLLIGAPTTSAVDELSCGHAIDPALYALDAFVPALEIGQERKCAITVDAQGVPWRIGLAIYAVLGWIVTALTILTVSGVARRHLDA